MCGICGVIVFRDSDLPVEVDRMVKLMVRRGPDDEGIWYDEHRCGLGFRRLAIQDLTPAGHQPMISADGRHVLVFNGEVYNYNNLRQELEKKGIQFRSTGDSEVVLYALATWGKSALERFNGMFAIGFYDRQERTLLLARDHAGIKPLHYMHTNDGVVFGSQYNQLLSHPGSRRLRVSEDALSLYLRLGYIPSGYGILEQTHMLGAGCWTKFSTEGTAEQGKFFTFPSLQEPDLFGDEATEALGAALDVAVKHQLVADVPVGTFLSGGIDSPLISAIAYKYAPKSIKAYTIGTNGDQFDESQDAARYAQEIGIEHVVRHIRPQDSILMLDDVVDACSEPFGDFSIFPTLLVSKLARESATVMLSGDGGDELFWGYAKRFGSTIDGSSRFGTPLWLRQSQWGMKKIFGLGSAFAQMTYPTLGDWYLSKQATMQENHLRRLFPSGLQYPRGFDLFKFNGHGEDQTAKWVRANEFKGRMTNILQKVDHASMHTSLEVRVPLLDRQVIDVGARIDWRTCLDTNKMIGKKPLRNLLNRHISYQTTAKRGFTVPIGKWLRGPLRHKFEEYVLNRDNFLGFEFDQKAARTIYKEFESGLDCSWELWLLLSLALWEETHFRSTR